MPFAKWIIETVGHVHVCYICMLLDAGKLAIITIIRSFKIISLHFFTFVKVYGESDTNLKRTKLKPLYFYQAISSNLSLWFFNT